MESNGGNEKNKYCEEQMEKLNNASDMGIQLNAKEMRMIWEVFWIQLNDIRVMERCRRRRIEYCIEMLNRLDRIKFGKEQIGFTIIDGLYIIVIRHWLKSQSIQTNDKKLRIECK